jgi:hypothetical protein
MFVWIGSLHMYVTYMILWGNVSKYHFTHCVIHVMCMPFLDSLLVYKKNMMIIQMIVTSFDTIIMHEKVHSWSIYPIFSNRKKNVFVDNQVIFFAHLLLTVLSNDCHWVKSRSFHSHHITTVLTHCVLYEYVAILTFYDIRTILQELTSVGWYFLLLYWQRWNVISRTFKMNGKNSNYSWSCWCMLLFNIMLEHHFDIFENCGNLVSLRLCCKHITAKIYTHYNLRLFFLLGIEICSWSLWLHFIIVSSTVLRSHVTICCKCGTVYI